MLHVTSEVGRLRRVLIHEPGPEVDQMTPEMMEELLFDDILYGDQAREEHRHLRQTLTLFGVEVLEAQDLLADTLERREGREWILQLVHHLPRALRERMLEASATELASMLVEGVRRERQPGAIEEEDLFDLPPLPNWCFQRDPQIILGNSILFSAMATAARWRESLLARAIFRFHEELSAAPVLLDPFDRPDDQPMVLGLRRPRFEGGDVEVLSPDVVAVGFSERTNRAGVTQLRRALTRREGGPRWMLVVQMPQRRAYMHLDTLLTPIDRDACLLYPPVMMPGSEDEGRVYEFDLHRDEPTASVKTSFLSALADRGVQLEPIPCGGDDPLVQQREQWTDGANAFAIAPGVITLYDRNIATAEALSKRGWGIVHARDLLKEGTPVDPTQCGRLAVLMPSYEMSRARGGPHCLTHPLVREDAS